MPAAAAPPPAKADESASAVSHRPQASLGSILRYKACFGDHVEHWALDIYAIGTTARVAARAV